MGVWFWDVAMLCLSPPLPKHLIILVKAAVSASQLLVLLDDAALAFVIDEATIPADPFGSITRGIDGLKGGGEIV
jgi:uncharacterized protein YhhL (DUF1145 family)